MTNNFLLLILGMVGFTTIAVALLTVLGFLFNLVDKKREDYDMEYRIPEGKNNE